MTEEVMAVTKAKKPGLLRRIFWGLWVIVLTALLVLGFVFAAPWKVITLIAIFFAAATILPRIYRKWFWLAVGLVVLATIAWIFLPDDNEGWKPYQFDKELAQLQARYVVPDSENAAIAYDKILADWKQKEANEPNLPPEKFDFVRRNFWLTKDQPDAIAYIQYYQAMIEQLTKVNKFDRCFYMINANPLIMDEQMERTAAMRRWAYLLVIAANNNISEGNKAEAIEKYLTAIKMGQLISQQPDNLDVIVSFACESLGLGGINNFVINENANDIELDKLVEAVSKIKHDWSYDLPGLIDSEKLMTKNLCSGIFYQMNKKGIIRLSHDPSGMIGEDFQKQSNNKTFDGIKFPSGYWWKKFMRIQNIQLWFYAPATPEKLSEIVNASFERNNAMTKPDFDWSREPKNVPIESLFECGLNLSRQVNLMALINEQLYLGLHDTYLERTAQQKGTLLIIAMRRYKNANGHWPESLDEVKTLAPAEIFVDPMNNDSFVYKLTDDGFTLYGKGKNGIDEQGKYENNWPAKPGADDLLIWPFKSKVSKQQEQKTEN